MRVTWTVTAAEQRAVVREGTLLACRSRGAVAAVTLCSLGVVWAVRGLRDEHFLGDVCITVVVLWCALVLGIRRPLRRTVRDRYPVGSTATCETTELGMSLTDDRGDEFLSWGRFSVRSAGRSAVTLRDRIRRTDVVLPRMLVHQYALDRLERADPPPVPHPEDGLLRLTAEITEGLHADLQRAAARAYRRAADWWAPAATVGTFVVLGGLLSWWSVFFAGLALAALQVVAIPVGAASVRRLAGTMYPVGGVSVADHDVANRRMMLWTALGLIDIDLLSLRKTYVDDAAVSVRLPNSSRPLVIPRAVMLDGMVDALYSIKR